MALYCSFDFVGGPLLFIYVGNKDFHWYFWLIHFAATLILFNTNLGSFSLLIHFATSKSPLYGLYRCISAGRSKIVQKIWRNAAKKEGLVLHACWGKNPAFWSQSVVEWSYNGQGMTSFPRRRSVQRRRTEELIKKPFFPLKGKNHFIRKIWWKQRAREIL